LKLDPPVDGAKQVSGDLVGIDGDTVTIASPKGERAIPFANIISAKLLLTDKLIHATAPLSIEGVDTIKTEG
jgi:ribosome maturation factor RimP